MSQTRLCKDSSWGHDRNGSKLMNAKGQISLSQGLIHKNGKPSLSLKLSENPYLNKKQTVWLVNGDAKQVNSVNASNSLVWDSNCLEMSTYGTETVSPSRKKALPMADYCLSEAEGLNYPLLRDMSNSSCIDVDGLAGAYPIDMDGGGLSLESETAADKNKTADKKSKGKRKKNVNKKSTADPVSEKEDLNCNSLVISKIQSNTTTDAGRNQELQTEGMGKELDQKSCKSADSQDSAQKTRKGRKGPIVYAEDIPDYRGKEKIEDLLNFIGKSPNNDTLSKDKKKKGKKKSLHGRPCRSGAENKDEKTELLESGSTDLYPAKSSSLDKICCNCNNSEIDGCLGDDNGQADNSIVLNPEYSSPNSAGPFILVEKKGKKRLNASLNRPNKFAPKSPYRNRKLSSSVMHPHQPQHFHCNEKTELDSSYSDLEGSYKARRNSTGNVHMQMSTVQSITTEDSDNESWTSLPVSQGVQLINENSYPISYAKIAALSLPLSNSQSLNRSVPCSVSKTGENVPGCKETSAVVKANSVSVIKDNQVRRTSNGNEQSCCGSDISTENSDNSANYLLKDNDNYLDRRHSVGECVANGASVKEPKVTTSTPKNLHHDKGQKENKNETKEQDISFCDHKTSSIYKNIVSGLCLSSTENGEENFNLSLNNLNKAKNFNKSKLVSHHSLVQQQQQQQQQQCNIYVNNSNTKCNMTDILAVKFINPRDKKHNDKQYKITFGFFYDPDNKNGRNTTGSDTTIDSSSCPLSSELPTSLPAEPFLPKQVSNDKDEDHKKLEDRAAKPGCKEGNGVLKSSHNNNNNKINPGDEVMGKIPQLLGANCDSTEKTVKNTEAVKCVSKLNGVVLPTNKNSLETYSLRTNATPESATISTSSTLPTTSNPKTVSPTAVDDERPRGLSNIQGNNNLHHHHTSNKKTIPDSKCGGNNGDSTVRSLQDSLQFIALSYGDKIQMDNKQKVIHFRSDVADTQLFNQQEILSYLSNEYHRVCHLSGPSAIVRVGND